MDLVDRRENMMLEEDRISKLPDDVIHQILSFIDMKYAVQTCTLSKRWKLTWTSMPDLNLNCKTFCNSPKFAEFVKHALSHRNNLKEVSTVKLTFTGAATEYVVKSIVEYAYSHNVRKLSIMWSTMNKKYEFPRYLFSCHTLKHLTVEVNYGHGFCWVPQSTWDFPALETLDLRGIQFYDSVTKSLNLFAKCVNLKDLTLRSFSMDCLESFQVYAPQLSNLTITNADKFPGVLNVVAPQLLTLSFQATNFSTLHLTADGFHSLEKVNLSRSICGYPKEKYVPVLLDLFQKLRTTKYLILSVDIVEALSLCLDQLLHEPCPFDNLKCLKIDTMSLHPTEAYRAKIPTKVRNYLLHNSPTATVIMDIPQVAQKKRSMQQLHNETVAKKVANLEAEKQQPDTMDEEKRMLEAKLKIQDEVIANQKAEIKKQDEVIAEQKAMMEAANMQQEKLMSHIINSKVAELKVQIENGNPGYELIRSMGCQIKSIMELIPDGLKRVNMEAQLFSKYKELKTLVLTRIDSQLENIETELQGNVTHSEMTRSDNIQSQ